MKKLILMIALFLFTGCMTIKVQCIHVGNSTDIEGAIKGSDPSDSLNGNKGSLEIPLVK